MTKQTGEPIIGIIGGMGPYAGLDLVKSIFDNTLAATDQEHLSVALLSVPSSITDRTDYLVGKTDSNPGLGIASVALQLERLGARFAAIACNTAHAPSIFRLVENRLQNGQCRLRLLHLIDETIGFLQREFPSRQRIGVLSTTGTYLTKLYAQPLMRDGYTVVEPSLHVQTNLVHKTIYHEALGIKAQSNPVTDQAKQWLGTAINILIEDGAEVVILGCTELALAVDEHNSGLVPLVDPTAVMARALITAVAPHKLKPKPALAW